jgi:hypothetical protein
MWGWLRVAIQWEAFRTYPLFDGTLSDLSNAIYVDRQLKPERYLEQLEPLSDNTLGYVQLRVRDFRTRSVEDYAEILDDPDAWGKFEKTVMGLYFDDRIEMFPFERREYADMKRRKSDEGMTFSNPEAFHLVTKELIERRFSADRSDEVGERDLRDAIAAFRYAFVHNFWRLVTSRRGAAVVGLGMALLAPIGFAGLLALTAASRPAWWELGLGFLAGFAMVLAALLRTRHMIRRHTERYEEAIKASCNVLSSLLSIRVHSLTEVIPQLFHKIDRSKWQMLTESRLDDWPVEVKKWSKLAFWLSARVEHIELLMQVQMWRIRRLHYGIRWVGRLLSFWIGVIALLLSAGISGGLGLALHRAGRWNLDDPMALILFCVLAAITGLVSWLMAQMTFSYNTPDLDIIRRTLKTDTMRRFSNVRLHRQVAEHVSEQKQSQVYNESLLKR